MNKQAILKRMIILCWVLLFVCFIIKLCGANLFEIVCTNERFIEVCNFIDNTFLYYVLSFVFYYVNNFIYLLSATYKKMFKFKTILITTIILVLLYTIKIFYPKISFILEIIVMIGLPIALIRNIKVSLLSFILLNIFQLLSLFIKNIGIDILDTTFLISTILMLDYLIMNVIFYLYSNFLNNKGVIIYMGLFGFLWFSEDVTQWKAYRATLKNPKAIAKADKKIAQLESKQNGKL